MKKLFILSISLIGTVFTTSIFSMLTVVKRFTPASRVRVTKQQVRRLSPPKPTIQLKSPSQALTNTENNTQPLTVVEYLKQEKEQTSKVIDRIDKECMKVLAEISHESLSWEVNQAIGITMAAITIQAAPTLLRGAIFEHICNCMEDPTFVAISERENTLRCLKNTAHFLQGRYPNKDNLADKEIAENEFNRISKEIHNKFLS